MNTEGMLFPPGELPVATVVLREPGARVAADTRRWAAKRWSWLRPRTLPLLVAMAGLFCVVASGRYLSRYAVRPPAQTAAIDQDRADVATGDNTYYLVHLRPNDRNRIEQIEVELVPAQK